MLKKRCEWVPLDKADYVAYHDNEWGVPLYDDNKHFEILILEGAQAGLSWYTILKRREGYRKAFESFDPIKVAAMSDSYLESLMVNSDIIRNRLKIYSTRRNARIFLKIQEEYGTFNAYVWAFVEGKPIINYLQISKDTPAKTSESDALSTDLKKRGMNFVGTTIIYAYMQAVGLVNDHSSHCFIHKKE